jgi:hypothetical protein
MNTAYEHIHAVSGIRTRDPTNQAAEDRTATWMGFSNILQE